MRRIYEYVSDGSIPWMWDCEVARCLQDQTPSCVVLLFQMKSMVEGVLGVGFVNRMVYNRIEISSDN